MTLPATDNFNISDENPIATNWFEYSSFYGLRIISYKATGSTDGWCASYWDMDSFAADQYADITCSTLMDCGPAVRVSSGRNGYLVCTDNGTKDNIRLLKFVAGSGAQVGSSRSRTGANGDRLHAKVVGNIISFWANSETVNTETESSLSSGSAGMSAYGNNVGQMDDWEGGNVSAGGIYADNWHPEIQQPVREKIEIIGYQTLTRRRIRKCQEVMEDKFQAER